MTRIFRLKNTFAVGLSLMGVVLSGCSLVPKESTSPVVMGGMFPNPILNRSESQDDAPNVESVPEKSKNQLVGVFYATDRAPYLDSVEKPYFLGEKSTADNPVSYGKCVVSIPEDHEPGVLESKKWWKLEFEEDPEKHVVVKSASVLDPASFFDQIKSETAEAAHQRKMGKQALLFVHGFNVSFELAVRRTGQLAWDLDFPGVPIAYSWPSAGKLTKYSDDESSAEWAKPHLAKVLIDIQKNTDIEKIHIIAHSMGTRVLTGALVEAKAQGFKLKLNNVVLAAADIGVDEFREQIMPRIAGDAERLTLFANSDDRALQMSSRLHSTERLGRSGRNIVVLPGMDTIDATRVDRSFVGHSYFGGNSLMLRDMINLIVYNESPAQRRLTLQTNGAWTFFR